MKKNIFIILSLLCAAFGLRAQTAKSAFAVVIDNKSYQETKYEVDEYILSVEKDGLHPILLKGTWSTPDSLRESLRMLYYNNPTPIGGAVFIGDIPIVMVRDAQHLTSAFKMDQDKYPWNKSSVPSDRFYDDFDLEFKFLKQDSIHENLFYYQLKPTSAQRLDSEIYTGRIKPFENENKYEQLRLYLQKLVRVKNQKRELSHLLFFAGHGYNSESIVARMDEKNSFYEQFPWFKTQQNAIEYLYHDQTKSIKERLQSELQNPNIDLALLHHHGGSDKQYISGLLNASSPDQQTDALKYYLRSKLRQSKDTTATIRRFMAEKNYPKEWFKGAFDTAVQLQDSLLSAETEIAIPDVLGTSPQVPFVVLDACFNGSFHLDEYMAGAYIFGKGHTVVVQANSVNVLQDKWTNEFIGLLGLGLRAGHWNNLNAYLETHIFGDPSFRFSSPHLTFDINALFRQSLTKSVLGDKQLCSEFAEMQSMALRQLFNERQEMASDKLLAEFKSNPNGIVRMECLRLLTACNDDNFLECLTLAVNDNFELVRRQAVYLIGKSGNPRLIDPLLAVARRINCAKRVRFNFEEALSLFPQQEVISVFKEESGQEQYAVRPQETEAVLIDLITEKTSRWDKMLETILDSNADIKKRKTEIRSLRNYNIHPATQRLCDMLFTEKNDYIRILLIEALGWFNVSYQKHLIIETCKKIAEDASSAPPVRDEARKTISRLTSVWYR